MLCLKANYERIYRDIPINFNKNVFGKYRLESIGKGNKY